MFEFLQANADLELIGEWAGNLAGFLVTFSAVVACYHVYIGLGIKECRLGVFRSLMTILIAPILVYTVITHDVVANAIINVVWVALIVLSQVLYDLWNKYSKLPYFLREFSPKHSGMYLICRSEKSAMNWSFLRTVFNCKAYKTDKEGNVAFLLWVIPFDRDF